MNVATQQSMLYTLVNLPNLIKFSTEQFSGPTGGLPDAPFWVISTSRWTFRVQRIEKAGHASSNATLRDLNLGLARISLENRVYFVFNFALISRFRT